MSRHSTGCSFDNKCQSSMWDIDKYSSCRSIPVFLHSDIERYSTGHRSDNRRRCSRTDMSNICRQWSLQYHRSDKSHHSKDWQSHNSFLNSTTGMRLNVRKLNKILIRRDINSILPACTSSSCDRSSVLASNTAARIISLTVSASVAVGTSTT